MSLFSRTRTGLTTTAYISGYGGAPIGYVKNTHTYTHTHPREDQCEWHMMTRMTGPDCAVIRNSINTYTHRDTSYARPRCVLIRETFLVHCKETRRFAVLMEVARPVRLPLWLFFTPSGTCLLGLKPIRTPPVLS